MFQSYYIYIYLNMHMYMYVVYKCNSKNILPNRLLIVDKENTVLIM